MAHARQGSFLVPATLWKKLFTSLPALSLFAGSALGLSYPAQGNLITKCDTMEQKLYSIIIPAFNPGPKIEKTINSVLLQDGDLFECLVIDGGSTDGTAELLENYSGKIKIITEKDDGVYDAMNKGIELSAGRYLYFIGAGDSLRPGILGKLQSMLSLDEFMFVYGNVYMVDKGVIYDGEFDKAKLKQRNICQQAIFYERKLFEVMGGFETRFSVLADHAFNLKCFWNHRIQTKYLAYLIANYEGGGISAKETDSAFAQEYAEMMSIADASSTTSK